MGLSYSGAIAVKSGGFITGDIPPPPPAGWVAWNGTSDGTVFTPNNGNSGEAMLGTLYLDIVGQPGKVVLFERNYGKATVLTANTDGTISKGTSYNTDGATGGNSDGNIIMHNGLDRVVCIYRDFNHGGVRARLLEVPYTTNTVTAYNELSLTGSGMSGRIFKIDASRFLTTYSDGFATPKARIVTDNGNDTLSAGTAVNISAGGATYDSHGTVLSSTKAIVCGGYGSAAVQLLNISGTTISAQTGQSIGGTVVDSPKLVAVDNTKAIIAYASGGTLRMRVLTAGATSLTIGSEFNLGIGLLAKELLNIDGTYYGAICRNGNFNVNIVVFKYDGSNITLVNNKQLDATNNGYFGIAPLSSIKFMVSWMTGMILKTQQIIAP
jgi:hypothetical protein